MTGKDTCLNKNSCNCMIAAKTKDPGNVPFDTRVSEVVSKSKFPGNVHSDTTQNHDFMGPKPHMIVKSGFGLYQKQNS